MPTYAALLRGINVGGKSLIRMTDLKACFVDGGFDDVATYIASGNVLFGSTERGAAALTRRIERMLPTASSWTCPSCCARARRCARSSRTRRVASAPTRADTAPT